ncbi:MAG: tetratricopeptide repeat protein [Cytophagaceae bacterium]|nr:tetratricopeptide repeat protein [Cytophagaceae bacterium]
MNKLLFALLFSLVSLASAQAQLQNDPATQQLILQSLDKIYNQEFAQAQPLLARIRTRYAQHPVLPLLQAVQLYWQHFPLSGNKTAASQYTATLNKCVDLSEKLLKTGQHDTEASFFLLAAHSYLAMQQSDAGEFMQTVGEAKRAYTYMKKGFKLVEKNPEFYFSTGLYNYYREQYPNDHGAVKPFMFFFANGNKQLGLKQMETGFRRGNFTRIEAAYYLVHVLIKHENQPGRALAFSTELSSRFPKNLFFAGRHTEVLVLMGGYAEAEPIAERLMQAPGKVYPVAGTVLAGVIQEKFRKNDKAAAALYQKALKLPDGKSYTQDYFGMAWAGLGRIAHRTGDPAKAREYYRQALKIAEYRSTLDEAKRYLKEN